MWDMWENIKSDQDYGKLDEMRAKTITSQQFEETGTKARNKVQIRSCDLSSLTVILQ